MAIQFFDSWEDGTFAKWLTITGNPFVIITDPVKCGVKAIRSNLDDGEIYHVLNATPATQRFRFFFRIIPNPDEPPAGVGGEILFKVSLVGGFDIDLYVVTGGAPSPRLQLQAWGVAAANGTHALASNTWYCIEVRIEANNAAGVQKVYLDGDLDVTLNRTTDGKNFYRAYLESVQWTFGMDCRTAIDCYCYEDSDTEIGCGCFCCGHIEDALITNDGGSLTFEPIRWKERQVCNPTIQSVPTRDKGQRIDASVYVLKTRELRIKLRLTDAEKTTLLAIFNSFTMCTITTDSNGDGAIDWTYTAWFRSKKIVWDYREFGRCDEIDTRPWRADLIFDVESFSLGSYSCPAGAGTVKLNNHVLDGGVDCDKLSYIVGTEFAEVSVAHKPDWVAQAVEVDEGHYNRRLFEITYVIRATDDLKYCLDLILQGHVAVALVDSRYTISGNVWMVELEATWAGERNWANPWLVRITLIADYNDLTIAEYSP